MCFCYDFDMQSKILLFDFDGTIADSADATVRVYNEIARKSNLQLLTRENLVVLRGGSFMDNMRYMKVPLFKLPFIANSVRTAFKNEIPNLKVIEGIKGSLEILKSKGYKLYIVSSNAKENIESFLEHNGIREFDDVYSVSNLLGKHLKIKSLIKTHKWNKASVMYIGDEVRDIEAAKKAGLASVAVTWGYNTEEVLAKNNPTKLLRKPAELADI